jgi:hypothetical protein
METVQTYLTYHAFEGGYLTVRYARELLADAIACGLLSDAQYIGQVDVARETAIANETAARMAARMIYNYKGA